MVWTKIFCFDEIIHLAKIFCFDAMLQMTGDTVTYCLFIVLGLALTVRVKYSNEIVVQYAHVLCIVYCTVCRVLCLKYGQKYDSDNLIGDCGRPGCLS